MSSLLTNFVPKAAQNKEDLLDMIQHGAGKIINSKER